MNMVAVLSVPLMLTFDKQVVTTVNEGAKLYPDAVKFLPTHGGNDSLRLTAILFTLVLIGWAIWQSKRSNELES
jgi:hypothetical protein